MPSLSENPFTDVDSVLEWLATFTDFEQKQAHLLGRRSLDLGRIRRYCSALGHPERGGYAVAHVAGSKGKGSTCAFLENLALGAELSTGLFLSPHLVDVRERIRLDGRSIPVAAFLEEAASLRAAVRAVTADDELACPSFFEAMVLMAFRAFAGRDLALVEVGLGGRLDATNVVPKDVAVITRLDLEHTRVLGPDLESIGREKAGILTPGAPLVTALHPADPGGHAVHQRAREVGCEVLLADRDFRVVIRGEDAGEPFPRFDYEGLGRRFKNLRAGTPGRHQIENAGLALTAALILERQGTLQLEDEEVRASLAATRIPARQELFLGASTAALRGQGDLLLDSAHTPSSMEALALGLPALLPEGERTLLIGMLRDKDLARCLAPLRGHFVRAIVAPPRSPRALPADELAEALRRELDLPPASIRVALHPEEAMDLALDGPPGPLVATGSVYLAGALRALLSEDRTD